MTGTSIKLSLTLAATVALLTACGNPTVTTLSGNPGDDASTSPTPNPTATPAGPAIGLSLGASSIDTDIGINTQKVPFTITPANGFTGAVTVHAVNVPAGVLIADVVATVTDANPVSGELVVDASDFANAIPGAYSTLAVNAAAGAVAATPAPLTVNLTGTIHVNTKNIGTATTAADYFGGDAAAGGLHVHIGSAPSVTIVWTNTSGIQHRIHRGTDTDGGVSGATINGTVNSTALAAAINHSAGGDGMPASTWNMVVAPKDTTATTVVDFYCHIHGKTAMPGAVTIAP